MNVHQNPTVGILGGGQLARMMVLAGAPLGARFVVVDTTADACAGRVAPLETGGWVDPASLARLVDKVDVVTFDFENVPAASAEWLAARVPVAPNGHALAVAQDRMPEKALFESVGLPAAPHRQVDDRAGLDLALAEIGAPAVLKTRRLGYDGKGQFRLHTAADADAAWAALGPAAATTGLELEAMVPFQRELSVIAVRSHSGEFRAWPLVQNFHVDGVLSVSLAPAIVTPGMQATAVAHARAVAETLDYVGVLAVELFDVDGRLVGNEMAPRVHNSGHWTIEGALTSQFENHIRAVLDLPLGDTAANGVSLMFNWLGELPDVRAALGVPDAHWHAYDKAPRPGRKVGHATLRAPNYATLADRAMVFAKALGREAQLASVLPWLHAAADGKSAVPRG